MLIDAFSPFGSSRHVNPPWGRTQPRNDCDSGTCSASHNHQKHWMESVSRKLNAFGWNNCNLAHLTPFCPGALDKGRSRKPRASSLVAVSWNLQQWHRQPSHKMRMQLGQCMVLVPYLQIKLFSAGRWTGPQNNKHSCSSQAFSGIKHRRLNPQTLPPSAKRSPLYSRETLSSHPNLRQEKVLVIGTASCKKEHMERYHIRRHQRHVKQEIGCGRMFVFHGSYTSKNTVDSR